MALRAATTQARPERVVWIFRIALLVICLLVALPRGRFFPALFAAAALLAVSSASSRLHKEALPARFARAVEVALICAALGWTGLATSPFFFVLAAPVLAAGLFSGAVDAVILTGLGATGVLLVGAGWDQLTIVGYVTSAGQAVALALAVGFVAAWARRLLRLRPVVDQPLFSAAYRLLTQLRTVARQLPGTLDPVSVSRQLLDDLGQALPIRTAAVFARTEGGRLITLAGDVDDVPQWDVQISGDSPFAEAWTSQARQLFNVSASSWQVVLPLVVGLHTIGLVGLGGAGPPPETPVLEVLSKQCADAALRLETALLFADVRSIATSEERQRVAREIHDGIAQELVIVGYGIDNATSALPDEASEAKASLSQLRSEVTRIISELRLSLFDLRSDVDPHGGLGAAISSYLQNIGSKSGLRVHISLEEATRRLPATTEAELLRISQEAITNARKHARASNIWVGVNINPPQGGITVEDDGVGISTSRRPGSYGQSIMQERADRLGAKLEIGARPGGGTRVELTLLDSSPARAIPVAPTIGKEQDADRRAHR